MKFEPINLQDLSQDEERVNSRQTFLDQFVPMPEGVGSIRVRLLPPMPGKKLYQYNRVHAINGRKVQCPRPLVNGKWDRTVPCPICDYYAHLWNKADKLEADGRKQEAERFQLEARLLKPLERYYYNAIVRTLTVNGQVQKNVGPRILSVGKDLHGKILRGILGDQDERGLGDVTSLTHGYDYVIKKEMAGEFPRYSDSCFAREPSPAGTPEEIERWSRSLHDLEALRNPKSVEELERELAIHRKVIPDKVAFDEDAFDARFKVAEVSPATPVSGETLGSPSTVEPEAKSETPTLAELEAEMSEDLASLADDGFVQELRDMDRE